ncbi:alpha/beta fold hydrolase [Aquibium carbonis]|uniref:Alpha/beta fold hydrolase n=1 Tax=Aquibium carbonis TaxID=2495581 RepID=A0A429Z2N9_9HYPH|nr:alpha/beta fold hydrolase [Aquibium carbonis]RST87971.1 alpha/beta fold hydrolase [Aquibium carbonis]
MSDNIHARVQGTGPETVVLLHGFAGHHDAWHDIQPALAPIARVLAYDLPGHGRSLNYPGAGPAHVAAKAILADLGARGIARVHFAGHSMGGAIAVLAALRAPQTVASLTLLAPGGFGPEINFDLLRRYGAASNADDLRACMDEMSAPGFPMPTKYVAGLMAVRAVDGQRAKLIEIAGLITKGDRQGEIPRESLAALTMPTRVLWGTADTVLPYSQTTNLPANITLETLPGKGHMLLEEARETVIRAIRRAIRS